MIEQFSTSNTPIGNALQKVNWEKIEMADDEIRAKSARNDTAILPCLFFKTQQGLEYHLCHAEIDSSDNLVSVSDGDAPFSIAGGRGIVFEFTRKD